MLWIHFMVITLIYIHEPKTVTWATEYEIPDYAYSEKRRKNQYSDEIEYVNRENDRQKNSIYNSKSMSINIKKKHDGAFKDCQAIMKRGLQRYQKYAGKSHYRNRVLTPFFNKSTRYIPIDNYRPYGYNRLEIDLQKNGLDIYNLKNHRDFESTDHIKLPTIELRSQDAKTRNRQLTEGCGFTSNLREANKQARGEDRGGDLDNATVKNKNLTPNNLKGTAVTNKTVINSIQNKYKDTLNGMVGDKQRIANTDKTLTANPSTKKHLTTSRITEGLPEEQTTTRCKTALENDPVKPSIVSYHKGFKESSEVTTSNRNLLTVKINMTLKYRDGVTTEETVGSTMEVTPQRYGPGIVSTQTVLNNDNRAFNSNNGEKLKSQTNNTHDPNLIKLQNTLGRSVAKHRETLKTRSLQQIKQTDRKRSDFDIKKRGKRSRTDEKTVENLKASVENIADMKINKDSASQNKQKNYNKAGSTLLGNDAITTRLKKFKGLYDKLQLLQRNNEEFTDSDNVLISQDGVRMKNVKCPESGVSEIADRNHIVMDDFINSDLSDDNPMKQLSKIENKMFEQKKTRTKPEMKNKISENELYADDDSLKRDIHCCFQLNDKKNCSENLEKAKLKQIDLKIHNKRKNGSPMKETLIEMVLTKDRLANANNPSNLAVGNLYRYENSSERDRKNGYSSAGMRDLDVQDKSNSTEDAANKTDSNLQRLADGENENPADGQLSSKHMNIRLNSNLADRDRSSKIRFLNYLNKFRGEIGKNNSEITRGFPLGKLNYLEGIRVDRVNSIASSKTDNNFEAPQVGLGTYNLDTVKLNDAKELIGNNEIASKIINKCINLKNNISTILNILSTELKSRNMSCMESSLYSDELFTRGRYTDDKSKALDDNSFKSLVGTEEKNAVNSKDFKESEGKVIGDAATDKCNLTTSNTSLEMCKDKDTGVGQSRITPDTTAVLNIRMDEKPSASDWDTTESSVRNGATGTDINNKKVQMENASQITNYFNNDDTRTIGNGKDLDLIKTVKQIDCVTKINDDIPIPLLNLHMESSVGGNKHKNTLDVSTENEAVEATSSTTNYISNSDINKISMQINNFISAMDSNKTTARPQWKNELLQEKQKVINRTSDGSGALKKEKPYNYTQVGDATLFDMNKFTNIAQQIQFIPNRVAMNVMRSLFLNKNYTDLQDPIENKWKRDTVYADKWTRLNDNGKKKKRKSKSKKYKSEDVEATDNDDITIKTTMSNSWIRKKKIKQIYMPNIHSNQAAKAMEPPFFFADDIITISVTPYDYSAKSSQDKMRIGQVMLKNNVEQMEKSSKDTDGAILNEAKYFVMTNAKGPADKTKLQQTQMRKLHLKHKGNEKLGIQNRDIENVMKKNKLVDKRIDINMSTSQYEIKQENDAYNKIREKIKNTKQFNTKVLLNELEPSTQTPITKIATSNQLLLKAKENKNDLFDINNRDFTNNKQIKELRTQKYSGNSINNKSDRLMVENEEFIVTITLKPNNKLTPIVPQVESIINPKTENLKTENPKIITGNRKHKTEEPKTINVHTINMDYETGYVTTDNYKSCTLTHSLDSTSTEKSCGVTGGQFGQRNNATTQIVEGQGMMTGSCYTANELHTEQNESVQSTYQWACGYENTPRTNMQVCETTEWYRYYDNITDNRNECRILDISQEKHQKAVTYNEPYHCYRTNDIEKQTRINDENWNDHGVTEMRYLYKPDRSTDSGKTLCYPITTSIIYESSEISTPNTSGWRTETENEVTKSSVLENTIQIETRDMETSSEDKEDEKEKIDKDRKDGQTDGGRNISYHDTYTRLTLAPPTPEQIEEPVDDSDKTEDEEERENQKAIEDQTAVCMRQTEINGETPLFIETAYDVDDDDEDDEDDQEDTLDNQDVTFWQIATKKPSGSLQKTQSGRSEEDSGTASTDHMLKPQSVSIDIEAVKSQLERLLELLKDGPAVDRMNAFITVEPDSKLMTEPVELSEAYLIKYNRTLANNSTMASQRDANAHRNSTRPSSKVNIDGIIQELKTPFFLQNINNSRGMVFTKNSSATHPSRYSTDTKSPPGIIKIKNPVDENKISKGKKSFLNVTQISMEKDDSNETRTLGILEEDLKNIIYTWRSKEAERTSRSNRSKEEETTDVASTYSMLNLSSLTGLNRTIPSSSNDSYDDDEVILLDNASSDAGEWVLHGDAVSNIDPWGNFKLSDRSEDSDERNTDIRHDERIEAELNIPRQDAVQEEMERQNSNYNTNQKLFVKLIREPISKNCTSSNRHRKYFKAPRIDSELPKIIRDQELQVSLPGTHPLPLKEDKEKFDGINSHGDNKGFNRARICSKEIKKYGTDFQKLYAPRTYPISYRSESNYLEENGSNEVRRNKYYPSHSRKGKGCRARVAIENGRNLSAFTYGRENDNARKINRKKEGREDHWEMLDDSLLKAENNFDKTMTRKIDHNIRRKLERYNIKPRFLENGKIENSRKSSLNDLNLYNQRINRKFKLQNSVKKKNNANITPEEEKKIQKILDGIISRYNENVKEDWRRHKTNKFYLATMRNSAKKCKSYPTNRDPLTYQSVGGAAGIENRKYLVQHQLENSRFESELNKSSAYGKINKIGINNRLNRDIVKNSHRAAGTRRRIQSDTPGRAKETTSNLKSRIGSNDTIEEASFNETELYTENNNRSLNKLAEGERTLLIIDQKKEERDMVPLKKIISPNLVCTDVVSDRYPPIDSRDSCIDGIIKDSKQDNRNSHKNNISRQKSVIALPEQSKECKTNEIKENEEKLKGKIETSTELTKCKNVKNIDITPQFKQKNFEPPNQENKDNVFDKEDKKLNKSDFMNKYKALLKMYEDQYEKSEQSNRNNIMKDANGKKTKGVMDAGKKISSKSNDDATRESRVQRPNGKNKKKDYKLKQRDRGKQPQQPYSEEPVVKQVPDRADDPDDIEIETYDNDDEPITGKEISMNNRTRIEGNGTEVLRDNSLIHRQHISPPIFNKIKYWADVDAKNILIQTPKTKVWNESEVMDLDHVNTLLNKFYKNPRPGAGAAELNLMYKTSWDNFTSERPFPNPSFDMMTEETIGNESSDNDLYPAENRTDESPAPECENNVLRLPIKFNTSEFIKLLDYNKDNGQTEEREEKINNKWRDSERNRYIFDINRGPNGFKSRYFITFDSQAPDIVKLKNISTIPVDEFKNIMAARGHINNSLSNNTYFSNKKNIKENIKPEIRSVEKVSLWLKKPLCYNQTHRVPKIVIWLGEVWPPMSGSLAGPMMKHYLVQVDPLIKPSKFPNRHVDYPSQISKVVWKALLHGFKTTSKNGELTKQFSKLLTST